MKKSTKNIAYALATIGVIIIIMAIMQGMVISPVQDITVSCNKQTGCFASQLTACNYNIQYYIDSSKTAGYTFDCDNTCRIRCPDTNEYRVLNANYANKCYVYDSKATTIQAYAVCYASGQAISYRKVCSDGTDKTALSKNGNYPNYNLYQADDFGVMSGPPQKCDYGCIQLSNTNAQCLPKPTTTTPAYKSCVTQQCYAAGNEWTVVCIDSLGKVTDLVNACQAGCTNAKCDVVTPITPSIQTCSFAACANDMTTTCDDGTSITTYSCQAGCAIPTTQMCASVNGTIIPATSSCKAYEQQNADGTCSFDVVNAASSDGLKAFYQDNSIAVLISIAALFIIVALIILLKKR